MLKERDKLENIILKYVANSTTNKTGISESQKWCLELYERYNIPVAMSTDILSQRKDISQFNEFILFAICDVIKPDKIKEYFTDVEIKMFTGKKYETEQLGFPIKLHLIKIADDQYIGKITAQYLMQLREKQLINYNADTQRALRIMLKGGTKIARPYVDNKAVGEIEELYGSRNFIPNMITLNINTDDEKADYIYNEETETLTIKDITAFDIVDGYHRYLGMSRNFDKDNTFDYPMMVQVVMFSVGRAKQLIWQEDHKTKMKVTDAKTYNQFDGGNMVVTRLNADPECNLNAKITLDGTVNAGVMAQVINRLWFPKNPDRKEVITVTKDIRSRLNTFTEEVIDYLDKQWNTYEIITIMYGLRNDYTPEQIEKALKNIDKDAAKTLNQIKDVNSKATKILKEVY